jgi:hypothetical protein
MLQTFLESAPLGMLPLAVWLKIGDAALVAAWAVVAVLIADRVCKARGQSLGVSLTLAIPAAVLVAIGAFAVTDGARGVAVGLMSASLLVAVWTDLRFRRVFEALSYPSVVVIIAASIAAGRVTDALIGALVVAGPLGLIAVVTRGNMGLGDVAIALSIGAAFGLVSGATALWITFIVGGVVGVLLLRVGKDRKTAIPYVPLLGLGATITMAFGSTIDRFVFFVR